MTDARATLQPLVGEWSLAIVPLDAARPDVLPDIGARNTWEWLGTSRGLLLQRWSIPVEEAPDGIAVIGWDDERATYLQHYFVRPRRHPGLRAEPGRRGAHARADPR